MKNKIIPKDAALYCFNCMSDQPVTEGEFKDGKLPLFCGRCKQQISEMIFMNGRWQLHRCFYKNLFNKHSGVCVGGDSKETKT